MTIPHHVRKKLNIADDDYVELDEVENGVLLRPVKVIRPEHEYLYTKEWQKEEAPADKEIKDGKIAGPFELAEELINDLESLLRENI